MSKSGTGLTGLGPPALKPSLPSPKEETQLLHHDNPDEGKQKLPYPKAIFFIVGNEFCERFSYFGMRAILVLYLTQWLRFNKDLATGVYHSFVVLCYTMPMFGAILADGYIGKYRTIIYLSVVYILGNTVMTLTALPPPFWLGPMIGLILIGAGTGGIKPCVSAFGGDQFSSEQKKQRVQFFSVFYFTINLGSFSSMLVTPVIREYTRCFGSSCYPVAFCLPAILMIVSLVLFWLGRGLYKVYPPTGSVIKNFFCCIGRAIKNKWQMGKGQKNHWLDYADDKYEAPFLEDVKHVLRVFVLFIPLPAFWALFDQQGSRWTLQSTQLDRRVFGDWHVLPDQIQAINPLLIVILIPLFEGVIYPLLDKCRFPNRPLQRMVCGMALASVAFITAGCLQLKLDNSMAELNLAPNHSSIYHINVLPCPVKLNSPWVDSALDSWHQSSKQVVPSGNYTMSVNIPKDVLNSANGPCSDLAQTPQNTLQANLMPGSAYFILTSVNRQGQIQSKLFDYPLHKSSLGGALVGVIYIGQGVASEESPSGILNDTALNTMFSFNLSDFDATIYRHIPPGSYQISLIFNSSGNIHVDKSFTAKNGAVYTLVVLPGFNKSGVFEMLNFVDVQPNSVSVWYQFPQYIIITVGETLFAVTGLSFAYSQAPENMKSVVQAGWLLTTAVGNMFDVIIASVHIPSQVIAGLAMIASVVILLANTSQEKAIEFFFFATLMAVTTALFGVMTYFYKYVDNTSASHLLASFDSDREALVDSSKGSGPPPVTDNEKKGE